MNVAQKYKANVGVPGTQSGTGIAFGHANIKHRQETAHLHENEKAHLFAINPGGNTYVPGNKYCEKGPKEEVFAAAPVDQIITPFSGDWELTGKVKYKSSYINHIAYMEALYQRIGANQLKIIATGDGGLYSIMEINKSLMRDFDIFLVKDLGRLAEVIAAIIENLDQFDLTGGIDELIKNKKINKQILETIEIIDKEDATEFKKKNFGSNESPENEDYEVFRHFFFEFLKIAKKKKGNIKITTLKDFEKDLDEYLASCLK